MIFGFIMIVSFYVVNRFDFFTSKFQRFDWNFFKKIAMFYVRVSVFICFSPKKMNKTYGRAFDSVRALGYPLCRKYERDSSYIYSRNTIIA